MGITSSTSTETKPMIKLDLKELREPRKILSSISRRSFQNRIEQYQFDIYSDMSNIETYKNYGIFLPNYTLGVVFQFLHVDDLLKCTLSCKLFMRIIQCEYFWKVYYKNEARRENTDFKDVKASDNWKKEYYKSFFSNESLNRFYGENFTKSADPESKACHVFKIAIIGHVVGKTCLFLQFTQKEFKRDTVATIGFDFRIRYYRFGEEFVKMMIWDTSAYKYYQQAGSFLHDVDGVLVCFAINRKSTFQQAVEFYEEATFHVKEGCSFVWCGLQIDLEENREVGKDDINWYFQEKCGNMQNDYCECSAKENKFVNIPFGMILEKILTKYQ